MKKSQTSIETKNKQVSASSSKHKFVFEIPDGINYWGHTAEAAVAVIVPIHQLQSNIKSYCRTKNILVPIKDQFSQPKMHFPISSKL